jgi:hypothetical protein
VRVCFGQLDRREHFTPGQICRTWLAQGRRQICMVQRNHGSVHSAREQQQPPKHPPSDCWQTKHRIVDSRLFGLSMCSGKHSDRMPVRSERIAERSEWLRTMLDSLARERGRLNGANTTTKRHWHADTAQNQPSNTIHPDTDLGRSRRPRESTARKSRSAAPPIVRRGREDAD